MFDTFYQGKPIKLIILLNLFIVQNLYSAETCSRVAIVNYQEVLVDASSSNKGEGLRFYLEKDLEAKNLLDQYQEKNRPTLLSAATSTLGGLLIISNFLRSDSATRNGQSAKNGNLYLGSALIAISYLTSKTMQISNEKILDKAVNEYNKRNVPRIYFSPYHDDDSNGIGVGFQREF